MQQINIKTKFPGAFKLDGGILGSSWERLVMDNLKSFRIYMVLEYFLDPDDRDFDITLEDNGNMVVKYEGKEYNYDARQVFRGMYSYYCALKRIEMPSDYERVVEQFYNISDRNIIVPNWVELVREVHTPQKVVKNGQMKLFVDTASFVVTTARMERVDMVVLGSAGAGVRSGINSYAVAMALTSLGYVGTITGIDMLATNSVSKVGNFQIVNIEAEITDLTSTCTGKFEKVKGDVYGLNPATFPDRLYANGRRVSSDEVFLNKELMWTEKGNVLVVVTRNQVITLPYTHVYCDLYNRSNFWLMCQHKVAVCCSPYGFVSLKEPRVEAWTGGGYVQMRAQCVEQDCHCKRFFEYSQPFVKREVRWRNIKGGLDVFGSVSGYCSCLNCRYLAGLGRLVPRSVVSSMCAFLWYRPCVSSSTVKHIDQAFYRQGLVYGCMLRLGDDDPQKLMRYHLDESNEIISGKRKWKSYKTRLKIEDFERAVKMGLNMKSFSLSDVPIREVGVSGLGQRKLQLPVRVNFQAPQFPVSFKAFIDYEVRNLNFDMDDSYDESSEPELEWEKMPGEEKKKNEPDWDWEPQYTPSSPIYSPSSPVYSMSYESESEEFDPAFPKLEGGEDMEAEEY